MSMDAKEVLVNMDMVMVILRNKCIMKNMNMNMDMSVKEVLVNMEMDILRNKNIKKNINMNAKEVLAAIPINNPSLSNINLP